MALTAREKKEVEDDFRTIAAAAKWVNGTLASASKDRRAALMSKAGAYLDALDPIADKKAATRYSEDQLAHSQLIGDVDTAFEHLLHDLDGLCAQVLAVEDPSIPGLEEHSLPERFLWLLQHPCIACLPVGTISITPKNDLDHCEGQPVAADVTKLVWGSIDSNHYVAFRLC
jgi:hypothetical protein